MRGKLRPRVLIPAILFFIGAAMLAIPPFFRWYISDYDRYVEMIRGPFPFSYFGSAPVQLFSLGFFPIVFGLTFIILAMSLRFAAVGRPMPRSLTLAQGIALAISIGAIVLVLMAVLLPLLGALF